MCDLGLDLSYQVNGQTMTAVTRAVAEAGEKAVDAVKVWTILVDLKSIIWLLILVNFNLILLGKGSWGSLASIKANSTVS